MRAVNAFPFTAPCLLFSVLTACTPVPPGMAYVPAGPFVMGTDQEDTEHRAAEYGILKPWFEDEHPAHTANIPAYYLDKYEVTNADYRVFVRATQRRPPPDWGGSRHQRGLARHPVTSVTWDDADSYCRWAGKRLPTEAEWEKAARGFEGRLYPWGDQFEPHRANLGGARNGTTAVGSYPAGQSPMGVYDLAGNVWEWTADWYHPYPGNTVAAPDETPSGRVLRGSSWAGVGHFPPEALHAILAHNARGSFRFGADPNGRLNDVGFRCARDAE
jgi:formylglycine-generating enzyme required for sulfatase activity